MTSKSLVRWGSVRKCFLEKVCLRCTEGGSQALERVSHVWGFITGQLPCVTTDLGTGRETRDLPGLV